MEFIVNWLSLITTNIVKFFAMCRTFFQSILDVLWTIRSIIETLWFWLKTLTIASWDLIVWVFDWSLFEYLFNWFNSLTGFIGLWWTLFVVSLLSVVIIRIVIWFVFKMFRLNVDYKTMKTKRK